MSSTYQTYLGQGLTRSLVAMRAQEGSTRTVGYILLQLLYDLIGSDQVFDRLLNGPTDDVWLNPWVDYAAEAQLREILKERYRAMKQPCTAATAE
jgi:15-cis-phytoene desaturase